MACWELPLTSPLTRTFSGAGRFSCRKTDFGFTPGTIPIGEYLDRFFPEGTLPRPDDTLGTAAGREESYNLVFSRGYGERLSWIRDYFAGLERVYSRRNSASSSPLTGPTPCAIR